MNDKPFFSGGGGWGRDRNFSLVKFYERDVIHSSLPKEN